MHTLAIGESSAQQRYDLFKTLYFPNQLLHLLFFCFNKMANDQVIKLPSALTECGIIWITSNQCAQFISILNKSVLFCYDFVLCLRFCRQFYVKSPILFYAFCSRQIRRPGKMITYRVPDVRCIPKPCHLLLPA